MKIFTIKENHLFSKAYRKGKKSVCKNICVYVMPDYHAARLQRENPLKLGICRVGLTVTKKLGGAVVRNRIKRIMREAYCMIHKEYCVKTGIIIIIVAREAAVKAKTEDIYKDMVEAFYSLKIL